MKRRVAAALAALVLVAGCERTTTVGNCVGLFDDRDPAYVWALSKTNVILGIVLVETGIVPVYVALWETYCPVGRKVEAKPT